MAVIIQIFIIAVAIVLIALLAAFGGGAVVLLLIRKFVKTIRWIFGFDDKKGGE